MLPPIKPAAGAANHDGQKQCKPKPTPADPLACQTYGLQIAPLMGRNEITFLWWRRVGFFKTPRGLVYLLVHLVSGLRNTIWVLHFRAPHHRRPTNKHPA